MLQIILLVFLGATLVVSNPHQLGSKSNISFQGVIWNDDTVDDSEVVAVPIRRNQVIPESWDIRVNGPGKLTPVKYQGGCQSCWAFAATGALENAYSIKTGHLVSLSEQQQVDCNRDSYGCRGGHIHKAFLYTKNGLAKGSDYPYLEQTMEEGIAGECREHNYEKVANNVDFYRLPSDPKSVKMYLMRQGACTVCVDSRGWEDYYGGIFNGATHEPLRCNHAVVLVGWGPGYWLIRNSAGDEWGEEGYIRVSDEKVGGMFLDRIYCPTMD